jgi:hypothetical protein
MYIIVFALNYQENLRYVGDWYCALIIDIGVDSFQSSFKDPGAYWLSCAIPVVLQVFKDLDNNCSQKPHLKIVVF